METEHSKTHAYKEAFWLHFRISRYTDRICGPYSKEYIL